MCVETEGLLPVTVAGLPFEEPGGATLRAYWLEEPLPPVDIEGYRALRRLISLRIAAGEMVRSPREARDLVVRGGVDVIQPDVVLAGRIGGCRRIAALADLCGRVFSPHTWSNGLGLEANPQLRHYRKKAHGTRVSRTGFGGDRFSWFPCSWW
jgi:hypothetical protein